MFQLCAWKPVAVGIGIAGVAILSCDSVGSQHGSVSATRLNPVSQLPLSNVTSPLLSETAMVPAGTRLQIRLEEAIKQERKSSGDRFAASLYGPLWFDGKFLAPSRSKLIAQLTDIDSDRPGGRSRLTIVLRKLILNRQEYRLDTLPLTVETAADTYSGVAIGSEIGSGFVAGYTLATKGSPVANGSQSRFALTLSAPVELPVIRRVRGDLVSEGPNHLGFVSQEIGRSRD